MSYLDVIPKDVRTLLDRYILHDNWRKLYLIFETIAWALSGNERDRINECMACLGLKTHLKISPCYYTEINMHPEDVITDVALTSIGKSLPVRNARTFAKPI